MEREERVARFDSPPIIEQCDSLPLDDFLHDLEFRFYSYDLILPNSRDGLELCDDFTDLPFPEGRLVACFDVGRRVWRSRPRATRYFASCWNPCPAGKRS